MGQTQEKEDSQFNINHPFPQTSSETSVLMEIEQVQQELCTFCEKLLELNCVIRFEKCNVKMHDKCGELDLNTEANIICPLCARGNSLINIQNDCYERQKRRAEKMVTFSAENFQPLIIGDSVSLSVPNVDRGPFDFNNILGIVTVIQNGVYKIGTQEGIINGWFPRCDIQKTGSQIISLSNVNNDNHISLREAASMQSISGGQGIKKCNCKAAKNQCKSNRCSCFK
ncbi:uncharacterized protein LOC122500018 isoform X1 [Leptopilina heterotoma]|uniref:uncharacterized protein LOC122500018 isoform X1 n=1 Tax=Leptopilina heterotoma TaxID=63436 RepID=UPI001CA8A973|nr:uncharacterized protein LOC122500018 isoform X1 [Leptopilina heterotoma]XP_043464628.1 uncharacterized protein LOC122500018 isoform X1 [Leptopilina heterotoma]